MRRFFIIGIVLLGFLVYGLSNIAADNLLVNGDFENGTDGWSKYGGILQTASSPVYEGNFSAEHVNSVAGTKFIYQKVQGIIGGTEYVVHGWVYFSEPNIQSTWIRLAWYTTSDCSGTQAGVVDSASYIMPLPLWREITLTWSSPPSAQCVAIRLMTSVLFPSTHTYWDDISLEPLTTPTPTPTDTPTFTPTPSPTPTDTPTHTPTPSPTPTDTPTFTPTPSPTPTDTPTYTPTPSPTPTDTPTPTPTPSPTPTDTPTFTPTPSPTPTPTRCWSSLGGEVYQDLNEDGVYQYGNEPGIPHVRVTLDGPVHRSTYTNDQGWWQVGGLPQGVYTISVSPPAGYQVNSPAPLSYTVKTLCERYLYLHFGLVLLPTPTPEPLVTPIAMHGGVQGYVWHDLNRDAIRQPGEPGIAGVVVKLYGAQALSLRTSRMETQTNAEGFYRFEHVSPGVYVLEVVRPRGSYPTTVEYVEIQPNGQTTVQKDFGFVLLGRSIFHPFLIDSFP